MDLVKSTRVNTKQLITHRLSLDEIEEAYELFSCQMAFFHLDNFAASSIIGLGHARLGIVYCCVTGAANILKYMGRIILVDSKKIL
ncbi:MAG: hypothetical protein RIG61_11360 [Deltaproteobacteria bacterium]